MSQTLRAQSARPSEASAGSEALRGYRPGT